MKEKLKSLAARIESIKGKVVNEEATKQAMILPFLQILGYDIFNPEEVAPEVPCDITNKGDRIDYIINKDGKPTILIECKDCNQNLGLHINQLRKYYVASEARFAILTNGISYLFFADHDKQNIMDNKPFYTLSMNRLSDTDVFFLQGFRKETFNSMQLLSQSQDIKYRDEILSNLRKEFANPSKGLVSLLTSDFYNGKLHESIYNKFSNIVKDCLELILIEGFNKNDEVVRVEKKTEEEACKYSEEEQKVINIVNGWLRKYETDKFYIYVSKLSNGYIGFCYCNKWWNICRIKVTWDKRLRVKICKEAISAKSLIIDVEDIEKLESVRHEVESQCDDTKSRFFKYRLEHSTL